MAGSQASSMMTVLVVSCDEYSDLLGPFIELFWKYWPDCPFELVQCGQTVAAKGFDRSLLCGAGKNWSERLDYALAKISAPYVLLLLDDYFISSRVDTALILRRLEEARRTDALNFRLCPDPPRAVKNTAYSISCKVGIWNRECLHSLVKKTGSAWEFERFGSFMFDESDSRPLMVTEKLEFPFVDAVHKGYWEKRGVACMSENGIVYDFSRRGEPPLKVRLRESLKSLVFKIFPADLIVKEQNAMEKLLKRFRS